MNAITQSFIADTEQNPKRDAAWKSLTRSANKALEDRQIKTARALYKMALIEAGTLIAQNDPSRLSLPLPVIFNISCHNLADLAADDQDDEERYGYLVLAFETLCAKARRADVPLGLRNACMRHLIHSLSALAEHLKQTAEGQAATELFISQAKEVSARVAYATGHAQDCNFTPNGGSAREN